MSEADGASIYAPFQKRGGKLLMYHGWADPVVPPENTIQYYEGVERRSGGDTGSFLRLFMVPGMYHCGGGPGATKFDTSRMRPDTWVSSGQALDCLLATAPGKWNWGCFTVRHVPTLQTLRWDGENSVSSAASFRCVLPEKGK